MSKQQNKKSKKIGWVLGMLLLGGLVFGLSQYGTTTSVTNNSSSQTPPVEEDEVVNESEEKLEEIRSREYIQRQQELLVQETFLKEEKVRIENEKKEAIIQFDAQIAALEQAKTNSVNSFDEKIANKETQLEEVRAEKIDFQ